MKKSIISALIALIIVAACSRKVDQGPREVNYDRDICVLCLMGIAERNYAAQSINTYGEVVWYDDIGCLVSFMNNEDWKKFDGDESVSWISDSETGEWIRVDLAWFTYGKQTPMGYGYSAHKEWSEGAFDFATTVQRIKDGVTMREEFLKNKKMLHHDH